MQGGLKPWFNEDRSGEGIFWRLDHLDVGRDPTRTRDTES